MKDVKEERDDRDERDGDDDRAPPPHENGHEDDDRKGMLDSLRQWGGRETNIHFTESLRPVEDELDTAE